MNHPILGIVGGVGPYATTIFMQKIIEATPAQTDQDNIPMYVINDPQIPDRTAYILDNKNPNPYPEMISVAQKLEKMGADYLAIPCNTAHYFYEEIAKKISIPFLNIMELCVEAIKQDYPSATSVGLLATDGTVQSKVFQNYFKSAGISVIIPEKPTQESIMNYIYKNVKANNLSDASPILQAAQELKRKGADVVVLGCTELSAGFSTVKEKPNNIIDSLEVLAKKCVSFYAEHGNNQGQCVSF